MLGRRPKITGVLLWWSYRRLCSMRRTAEAIVCPLLANSQFNFMGRKNRFPTVLENLLVLSFVVRENIKNSTFHGAKVIKTH